jgi:hypothetical protein
MMNISKELEKIRALEERAIKADQIYNELVRAGGISRQHVISLESLQPGILMDLNLPGGFSNELSDRHYTISLEQASLLKKLLFGAAFATILYFFKRVLQNSGLFGSSSGSGGGDGGGGSGGWDDSFGKVKKKHKDSEEKLKKKTEQLRAVQAPKEIVLKSLAEEDFKFLSEIGVDKTIIDSIRASAKTAHTYFLEFDNDQYSQFMHDAFVYELNKGMCMVVTSPSWEAFQKRALMLATIIKENRDSRVDKLTMICDDVDHYVKMLTREVDEQTLMVQGNDSTYVQHAANDPEDIIQLRKALSLPPDRTARDVASDVYELFHEWMKVASDPAHKYRFTSKKDFEVRVSDSLMALINIDQDYMRYMSSKTDDLLDRLRASQKIINDLDKRLSVMIRENEGDVPDETPVENMAPTTRLYNLKMIEVELDKARRFIHSYVISSENIFGAMGVVASMANMVYSSYERGYKRNVQAENLLNRLLMRMQEATDNIK